MISDCFSKVNVEGGFIDKLTPSQLGKKISINLGNSIQGLDQFDAVICSLDTEKSKYDREMLYQMYDHFDQLKLADLGVFKNDSLAYVLKVLAELFLKDVRVIFLDTPLEYTHKIIEKTNTKNALSNVFISESNQLDIPSYPNYNLVAYQKHKCSPSTLKLLKTKKYNSLSLGEYRDDFKRIEPILRDTQFLAFHPSATQFNKPNAIQIGLNIEESCQMMKYAGLGQHLQTLCFIQSSNNYNYAVADMIWYYLEGMNLLLNEDPNTKFGFQEYIISSKEQDYDFSFIRSETTDRWWLKIISEKHDRDHTYLSCSKEEYDEVCKDKVPYRLLKFIESL